LKLSLTKNIENPFIEAIVTSGRHQLSGSSEVITIGGNLFINETTVGRSLSLRVELLIEPTLDGV
jgi:hypothetical protein